MYVLKARSRKINKMVNKRFLQTAERWMNKDAPSERPKPREEKPDKGLTQILQRDSNGKPRLKLKPIEKTVVHTPTQKDYWDLIRIYECGGWKWGSEELPTQNNHWNYEEETCVDAGVDYPSGIYDKGMFGFADRKFYIGENWKIISTQGFYDTQKITPGMLNEINVWFDENA